MNGIRCSGCSGEPVPMSIIQKWLNINVRHLKLCVFRSYVILGCFCANLNTYGHSGTDIRFPREPVPGCPMVVKPSHATYQTSCFWKICQSFAVFDRLEYNWPLWNRCPSSNFIDWMLVFIVSLSRFWRDCSYVSKKSGISRNSSQDEFESHSEFWGKDSNSRILRVLRYSFSAFWRNTFQDSKRIPFTGFRKSF